MLLGLVSGILPLNFNLILKSLAINFIYHFNMACGYLMAKPSLVNIILYWYQSKSSLFKCRGFSSVEETRVKLLCVNTKDHQAIEKLQKWKIRNLFFCLINCWIHIKTTIKRGKRWNSDFKCKLNLIQKSILTATCAKDYSAIVPLGPHQNNNTFQSLMSGSHCYSVMPTT